jgi:hypothetical protein
MALGVANLLIDVRCCFAASVIHPWIGHPTFDAEFEFALSLMDFLQLLLSFAL